MDGRIAGGGGLGLLVWLVGVVGLRMATRPLTLRPDPGPDRSRPPGSPALAALLVGQRAVPRRVLTATVLDLSARGYVDLPVQDGVVWVRVRRRPDQHLTAYERLVLEHLARRGAGEVAPLAVCAVNGVDATATLCAAFARAVSDEALRDGLCVERCPPLVRLLLRLAAFVPFVLLALSVARQVPVWTALVYLGVAVLLGWWLGLLVRPLARFRLSRSGRTQAVRWAAVRAAVADLPATAPPPAGDRSPAFAVALGAAVWPPIATFHEPDRGSVWSHVTGTWRRLTIREEHVEGWREPRLAIVARALAVCVAAPFTALLFWGFTDLVRIGSWRLSSVAVPVIGVSAGAGFIFLFRDTWPLARDFLRTPVVECADVVYTEYVASTGEYSASYHYVGLDSGTDDVLTVWDVPAATFRQLEYGVRVELRRTPVRHGFRSMTVRSHPTDIRWPPLLDDHQTA